MTDTVIRVDNLAKQYRISEVAQFDALRDVMAHSFRILFAPAAARRTARSPRTIWALRDVSFEVKHGELLGLIGRNGSGKSTLLKILSRITSPTHGTAEIRGRLGSLLEVGTGFHGELTGRENIYLSGAILGMKKAQIDRRFDDIVVFSEVERFLDTPVKHYSSGMYVRLAFAVAAHLEPDILLVDEVLAVGDSEFQQKCLKKMREVAYDGRTVLFVSHDLNAVQTLTNRTLLLESGRVLACGATADIIQQYLEKPVDESSTTYELEHAPRQDAHLSRAVSIVRLALDRSSNRLTLDQPLSVLATIRGNRSVRPFAFTMGFSLANGFRVGGLFGPEVHAIERGEEATFRLTLSRLPLSPGSYRCWLAVTQSNDSGSHEDFDLVYDVLHFQVTPRPNAFSLRETWIPGWGPVRFDEPKVDRIK